MSRGILMFGLNNETIDYLKMCVTNAALIKKNMGDIPVSVVTSEFALSWDWATANRELIDSLVDLIILPGMGGLEVPELHANKRIFRNTQYFNKTDVFLNQNRSSAYDLSPYDETLLIDCDYLVLSDSLNAVWGGVEDFLISKDAVHLNHGRLNATEWRLSPYGVRMYWATIVYFKKSGRAKMVFDLVTHIKNNWRFYSISYDFPSGLYRNDFAFSIAIHMLSGFQENVDFKTIPDTPILTSLDKDQLHAVKSATKLIFLVKSLDDEWKFSLQKVSGVNVHVMNKLALLELSDQIIEVAK